MSAAVPAKPAPKVPAEPLLRQLVRGAGLLVLLGAVPLVLLLPLGPKLVWTLVVTAIPLGFTVAGYHAWRRVCPLAFFATLGQRLQRQSKRKAGDWLAAHGLEVQLGLLALGMALRHLGANSTPWAMVSLFILVILAATVVGFLYTGKTWCNHLCPVGVVEKLYQEPVRLLPGEDNSQCAACSACKKNCPDIDLEQGYWKEIDSPARRRAYYLWPGLVLAFYVYFYLEAGSWAPYFSGAWARDTGLAARILQPGFTFAPVPRLLAVPLTFLVCGGLSLLAFSLLERAFLARASTDSARAQARHRGLSLAGFIGFILFYAFAGQPSIQALPTWLRQGLAIGLVMVATALLLARWSRSESAFVQEKFAKGLLKRWEWGDAPPSDRLSDLYLLHQERLQQREARLKAYKATVRDLLAEGVLNRGNLLLLQKVRAELGISDKDHEKLLSELTLEEKRLFDADYQGSLEKQLQLEQYRQELEALLLGGQPDPAALETLRRIHRLRPEEHLQILEELRGAEGPILAQMHTSVGAVVELAQARLAVASWASSAATGEGKSRAAFFSHVAAWRQRRHLEHLLLLLDAGQEPRLLELRKLLASARPGSVEEVITFLGAMADQGTLGAALAPLATLKANPGDLAETLRTSAQDHSKYVRAASLSLLACLGGEVAERALRQALLDPEPLVRDSARSLLGVQEGLGETLTELAGDEEQWLLRAAVQSLPGRPQEAAPDAALPILDTLILLHAVPLFAQLDPDDLEGLAGAAEVHTYAPEASLCRQGERSDEVFLLLSGHVQTWILDRNQQPQTLGEATAGACLGEMAVLDAAPRSATVTAQDEVRALVLGGAAFRDVLHAQPAVAEGVLRVLTQRLRALIQAPQAS